MHKEIFLPFLTIQLFENYHYHYNQYFKSIVISDGRGTEIIF